MNSLIRKRISLKAIIKKKFFVKKIIWYKISKGIIFIYDINNLYIFEVMLKYYNILENNYFKIIEQKNSIFYLIKKYKKNNNQFNEISSQ